VDPELMFFNVRSGILSEEEARVCGLGFRDKIQSIFDEYDVAMAVVPSGRMLSQKILSQFVKTYEVPAIYIGYGNLPNRTFLDGEGTDKESALFKDVSLLEGYNIDEKEFFRWKENYIEKKLDAHIVPQSRKFDATFLMKRVLRTFVCKIESVMGIAHDINYSFNMLKGKMEAVEVLFDLVIGKYVFFPMQLSNDAQVVQNYGKSVQNALYDALFIAREAGFKLVVKPHPAEVDPEISRFLNCMKESEGILLSNDNTFKLIQNSEFVVTINSTVGLESRLLGKDVRFLGDSLFERIPERLLGHYIMGYLFNLDYFNADLLCQDDFDKLDRIISLK